MTAVEPDLGTPQRRFNRVGVIGAGTMGAGVAQNLAQTGHSVIVVDVSSAALDRARAAVVLGVRHAALFDETVRTLRTSDILDRIAFVNDDVGLRDVDVVVENAVEQWTVKERIYARMDQICRQDCLIAANTSAISITRLASMLRRPDRVIGMHFMNPVPQKRVVEVVRGQRTSEATVAAARAFLAQMGKDAIVVRDKPGFVSNRVLMLAINEAIQVVQDEVASPADVDEIFVKCVGHKLGPLATADLIGLDTVLLTLEVLCEAYGPEKYQPCALLIEMVASGRCGRKSGRGFFDYRGGTA
jgi:3-hydroxybutyryl-CoA dehydrogenase